MYFPEEKNRVIIIIYIYILIYIVLKSFSNLTCSQFSTAPFLQLTIYLSFFFREVWPWTIDAFDRTPSLIATWAKLPLQWTHRTDGKYFLFARTMNALSRTKTIFCYVQPRRNISISNPNPHLLMPFGHYNSLPGQWTPQPGPLEFFLRGQWMPQPGPLQFFTWAMDASARSIKSKNFCDLESIGECISSSLA